MSKVVIVTGSPRGIGAVACKLAAERGYAVGVNDRANREAADQADVAIEAAKVRLFETVDRELGRVTALANNAGILEKQTRVEDLDAGRIARVSVSHIGHSPAP